MWKINNTVRTLHNSLKNYGLRLFTEGKRLWDLTVKNPYDTTEYGQEKKYVSPHKTTLYQAIICRRPYGDRRGHDFGQKLFTKRI